MYDKMISLAGTRTDNVSDIQAFKAAENKERNVVGRKIDSDYFFTSQEAADDYFGPMIEDAKKDLDSIAILPEGLASVYDLVTVGPIKFGPSASDLSSKRQYAESHVAHLERDLEGAKVGELPEPPKEFWSLKDIYG